MSKKLTAAELRTRSAQLQKYKREWRERKKLDPEWMRYEAERTAKKNVRLKSYKSVWQKANAKRPDVVARRRARAAVPAYKAWQRVYQSRPEVLAAGAVRRKRVRQENPALAQEKHRRRKYGLSTAVVLALLDLQNNRCPICGRLADRNSSVDHCHKTGLVRGMLCRSCNAGIGQLRDSVELLRAAIAYLLAPPGAKIAAGLKPKLGRLV